MIDLNNKTPRILKVNGEEIPFLPSNGRYFILEEIHKALSGDGNNDPCMTMAGRCQGMLMVAEDNSIAMDLPPNHKASEFYSMAGRIPGSTIYGNCLLMPVSMMH